ncbi:DNA replication factor C complex subunit Rfc1 [Paraconiothyrium brasiliense]|uniref:DNA replication factor C complex subunit Rfc1 n=1 Tax=Paraconiothyrium brasiliense TaxID=300254 RepID=A0ABR3RLU2_9PLEO
MAPKKAAPSISVRPDALSDEKCIITGEIEGFKRKEAEQILIDAGATIEKSLNKKVTLVVLGADAGPQKLEKIEKLGIETKDWNELIEEIQGEGGAAPANDDEGDDDEDEEMEEPEEKPEPKKKVAPKAKANTKAKANPAPAAKPTPSSSGDDFLSGKHVIITGTIPGHDRKDAQTILEKEGAIFEKSLNKKVELVVLGGNPGPDKLEKIKDLGAEVIEWKEVAKKLGLELAPEKKVANVEAGAAPDSVDGKTLLITGEIDGLTRSAAQKVLEGAGAKFAKTLNKSVELVVLGANAGPDKLNKIADQGIPTVEWSELIDELGIDVEASEPPKKKAKKN